MSTTPASHITDAHLLAADGKVELYEVTPTRSIGVLRFSASADLVWQGNTYIGIPCAIVGDKRNVDNLSPMPRFSIGQPDISLSQFKPFINDGSLDGARIRRLKILRADIVANNNIFEEFIYRVKRVESYSRTQIMLLLSAQSDSTNFTVPFRKYLPPAFPSVQV